MGKASIVIIENVAKQQFSRSIHCFIFSWLHQYGGGTWDTHMGMNEQNWLMITKEEKNFLHEVWVVICAHTDFNLDLHQKKIIESIYPSVVWTTR